MASADRPASEGQPIGLLPAQFGVERARRADRPIPVTAWVPYTGGRHVSVEAVAGGWTSRAVRISWRDRDGAHDVWVWANAVERRHPPGVVGLPATERPGLLAYRPGVAPDPSPHADRPRPA